MNGSNTPNRLATALSDLVPVFAGRVTDLDASDAFAGQNVQDLKDRKVLSAMVPAAFGGGGADFSEMTAFLRSLAQACPSTALCLSMHQHVVATNIVNARLGRPGEALLRKVAANEALITTTVAKDWIASSGTARPVEGGFRVDAHKTFVSGAPAGDVLVTSARTEGEAGIPEVLHFAISYDADGLQVCGEWRAHGMRGTGTVDVKLDGVLVPESAITLRRPAEGLHPLFHVILTVAPTLIMSCYMGIADRARDLAIDAVCRERPDSLRHARIGELEAAHTTAKLAHQDMVALVQELQFDPSPERATDVLVRKSILSENVMATCGLCAAIVGAAGYLRSSEIERLLRDARAAAMHPMPTDQLYVHAGEMLCRTP
ncbi:acyl-CoA dehydrogenase family protein [uncultured Roseobacter sp.]|uniref:acyl-CoA dehydrogenase family protein n=1 Tax=uncultured Roseobacter sp. TaxID=114847 RepID=UPI002635DCDE|nr:acyl-CoA dehydrogenase family protein [uncultured Roseobacter sp.]